MKRIYLLCFLFCLRLPAIAQTVVSTGFENGGSFPPPGWTLSGSSSYLMIASGTGGSPTTSGPHGGSYYCEFNSYSASGGTTALLISPVVDWTTRGGVATSVTMWWYRDVSAYNTATYNAEGVTVYVNTSPTVTGATSMGFVPRRGGRAISGGVTGTSTTTTSGWYQYTFTVPTTFNSATNYIIFSFNSQFGDNCFMDDIQYTTYPCTTPAITGTLTTCVGATTTLSDATGGGTWLSSTPAVATINSSGVVSGVSVGTTTITYTPPVGCQKTAVVTVNPSPVITVSASPSTICPAFSSTLTATSTNPGATSYNVTSIPYSAVTQTSPVSASWTSNDDGSSSYTLPFTFTYFGTPYTSVNIGTNGYVQLGGSSTVYSPSAYPTTNLPGGISLFWSDLDVISPGSITYSTEGTAPNRKFVISYNQVSPCCTYADSYDGQVILYETSNTIDILVSNAASNTHVCGIQDATGTVAVTPPGRNYTTYAITTPEAWRFALPQPAYAWSPATSLSSTTSSTPVAGPLSVTATYTVTATAANGCSAKAPVTINVNPSPAAIGGPSAICVNNTTTYTDASGAGTWSSSAPVVGTINAATGSFAALSPGTTTITFTLASTGCTKTLVVTVNPLPGAISGFPIVCAGSSTTLTDAGGGTWTSSNTSLATIGSSSGLLTGVSSGSLVITYTLPTGCNTTTAASVNPLPAPITGMAPVCGGSVPTSATVHDATTGGTWSSSNTSLATIGSSGIITGVAAGNPVISYTLPTGCSVTAPATVNAVAPITGFLSVCIGISVTLSDATPGGNWTSGNTAIATINSSGLCSGVTLGSVAISYTVPSMGCAAKAIVSVTNAPVPYDVTGGGAYCAGSTGPHIGLSNSSSLATYQVFNGTTAMSGLITGINAAIDLGAYSTPGAYTVVANPGTACAVTMNGGALITALPLPSAFSVTGGGAYCAGGTGVHIGLSSSNTGVNYQLKNGTGSIGSPVAGTGTLLDFGLITATGTYSVTATSTATGCTANMTGTAAVSTNTAPSVFSMTGGGSFCTGGSGVAVGLGGSASGIRYQLFRGGVPTGSPVTGTGSSISFGIQTIAGTYTAVATNTVTGCTANMTGTSTVVVNTLPVTYNMTGGGAYCTGGTGVHVGLNGSVSGITYTLYKGGVTTGVSVSGTGSALDFGTFTATGTYTAVATNATTGCTANMTGSATVSTNPLPGTFTVTGGGAYCAGGTGVHVGLSGSSAGVTYYLYNGSSVAGGASGTTAALDFGLELSAGTYTVVATIAATGCTTTMAGSATVTVNPLPAAYSVTGGGGFCSGTAGPHVILSNSDVGTNYRLLNGGVIVGSSTPGSGSSIDFGAFTAPGTYTVAATNSSTGCVNAMSGSAAISVNPLPVAYNVTGGGGYCSGGTGVHIGLAGSAAGTNYQLVKGGATVATLPGTGATLDFGLQTAGGTYTVVATNTTTGCTGNMSGSATVTANALPTAYAVGGGGSYCTGGSGLVVTLGGSDVGTTYQLYLGGTATGAPLAGTGGALNFGFRTVPGSYTVTATKTATGCTSSMSGTAAIATAPLPTIFTVTGGGNYCAGGAGVHVGLSNSTTGVNYQLYRGGAAIGSAVPGSSLPLDFGAQTVSGTYSVIATDGTSGCTSAMTGGATISVIVSALPTAFAVTGGGAYCSGSTGVHTGLTSSVPGVSYQLYNGTAGMGTALTGTGSSLDFGLQTMAGSYTVVATDPVTGCANNMTGSATITVNSLPSAFAVTGGGNYCVGGSGVSIGLGSSTAGVNYQLYNSGTAVGSPLAGSGSSISFGPQTAAGSYTVQAVNTATGCGSNMSGSATVNILPLPTVYNVTGGGGYCASGTGVTVGLGGSDAGISYQLYNGSAVGAPVAGTGAPISFGLQTAAGNYTVIATGTPLTCISNMNGSATVAVNPGPVVHHVTGGGSYCSGGTGINVGLDAADAGINYQLYNGPITEGAPVSGSGAVLSFGRQLAAGIYTVQATDATTGCSSVMSGSASVGINLLPAIHAMTGGGAYCSGGAGAGVHLDGSDTGITYQLYNSPTTIVTSVTGAGTALDFGLQPAGTYTVKAVNPISGCTSNMNGSAVVSVNPLPAAYAMTGGGSYCAGGTGVDVQLNGSAPGISYQLYNGLTPISTAVTGSGASIDFGLQTSAGVYTVQARNTATGCVNTMTGGATVTAHALPVAYTVTGSSPAYCAGGTGVAISLTNSDFGTDYQLYVGGLVAGSPVHGTGSMLSFGPQTTAGNYTVVATNVSSGCTSNMTGVASVAVNAQPDAFTVTGGGAYCTGGSGVHVGLASSASGINYQLYQGATTIGSMPGNGTALDFGLQATAGNYTIVATNPLTGCTASMTGSATIGINPLPAAYPVIGGGSYCAGGTGVNVALLSSAPGTQYQLYAGATPVGSPAPGTGGPINFGRQTASGIYTVVATNATTGCSSNMAGSSSVFINPQPVAYTVTGGGSYCAGSAGVHLGLSNTDTGARYQLYYNSSLSGSALAGTGLAVDFGLATAAGNYTVTATDTITGCTSNMAGSATVSVSALPIAYAVTGGGNYCSGGSGVRVGLGNSATGVDYTLSSGSAISTLHGTGGALDFGLQTMTGTYTITAHNATTGCANNMTGSAAIHMDSVVAPAVMLSSATGSTACAGHMSHFTAMPSNGGSAPAYSWFVNGTPYGSGNTFNYAAADGDVVSVTMSSSAACAMPLSASDHMTMAVGTTQRPTVLLASDHGDETCQGTTVTFTAVPQYGGSAPIYTWVKNGVADTLVTAGSYSYTPANGDNVYCILHSNYSCRTADTGSSNTIHMQVTVPQVPTVTISSSNGGNITAGEQEILTANVSNAGSSPEYQWSVNSRQIQGATLPVFTSRNLENMDVVSCQVTSGGACAGSGSGSITIHIATGVKQVVSQGSISISPNPNKGSFNITGSLNTAGDEEMTVEVTDMLGHVVYNSRIIAKNGKVAEHVQLGNTLANGMYLLSLNSENMHMVFHVVVEQ